MKLLSLQKQTSILIILLLVFSPIIRSDAVCDLATLQMEIAQDLADNGMLDCLRVIEPPHFVVESEIQKNLRLAAQWDSSCAFEADDKWMTILSRNFGINQLVDVIGDPVQKDFDDQADIAAVAKGKFKIENLNMQSIPKDKLIKGIDCAGTPDERGPRICAATGVSYYQKDAWTIFLTSSSMKLGRKPNFVKTVPPHKKPKDPRTSTDNLLKTLLKMGRKALISNESKVEQEPEHQNKNTRVAHIHVRRQGRTDFGQRSGFSPIHGGTFEYKLAQSRLVFSFYMLSFKLTRPGTFSSKFSFNGREIAETRQTLGLVTDGSLTSAFAEVYNPNGNKVTLGVLYESSTDGTINSSSYNHNLAYGSITLPVAPVFKHVNSRALVFMKTESWVSLPSFTLHINAPRDAYYLVFYNFGVKLKSKSTFHTRMTIGAKTYKETSVASGSLEYVGNHCGRVVRLNAGRHSAKIDYKFNGDEGFTVNDFTNPRYVQSMVAFELPPSTIVRNYNLDRTISLNTFGGFKPFGFNVNLKLAKKKTVLIIYNVNLKANGSEFAVRVRMGNKFNRKSVLAMKNLEFGRAMGYVVRVLKEGSYNFDLDYRTDSKESFNPDTADSQTVSMQIIEID